MGPMRRDWVLVLLLVLLALIEGLVAQQVQWRALTVAVTIAAALTLPWRRVSPLYMLVLAFGFSAVVQVVALLLDVDWRGLNCNVFVIIYPYALLRWASGRESILGLICVAILITPAMLLEQRTWLEVLGASMFILVPAALGLSMRYQDSAKRSSNERVRLQEREQLARELHDTVAHHVSAIAIQAQAGRALSATQPSAALEVLGIIEEAASRSLVEMRQIVTTLRDDSEVIQAPVATLADIKRLAQEQTYPLRIEVDFKGDLGKLSSTLQSTLFRLTQEAVTNSVRHSKNATTINIRVRSENDTVHLSVFNDGDAITNRPPDGLGLRGMKERVALLGGTVNAGPRKIGGWLVEANFPKFDGEFLP